MVKFRFALLLAVGAVMQLAPLAPAVSAAEMDGARDIPYSFVPKWNGLYIGVHGGAALGNTSTADTYHYNYYYYGVRNGTASTASNSMDALGGFGGGQIGYNFQWRRLVFGLEAEGGYLALSQSKSFAFAPSKDCLSDHWWYTDRCSIGAKYSSSGGAYGDLTGRLGFLLGRTLFYGKGGVAVMQNNFKAAYTGGTSKGAHTFDFGKDDMLWGWTAGGGVEYALSTSWSLKAEYQHFDFGSFSYNHNAQTVVDWGRCGVKQTYSLKGNAAISQTADTVKLGINYRLNDEAELK